ncbi:MAG: hypothetical protein ABI780_00920 [Ardenticatenales bacterium]
MPRSPASSVRTGAACAFALLALGAAGLRIAESPIAAARRSARASARVLDDPRQHLAAQSALSTPVAAPDIALALDAPVAVAPGGRWSITARAANVGDAAAAGAWITLTLPTTVTLLDATAPFSASSGLATWQLPAAAPGATVTRTAMVRVPLDAVPGSALRAAAVAATAEDVDPSNDAADAVARIVSADLRTDVACAARDVRPGEAVTWTVLAANVSPVIAEDVVVRFTLDPQTEFVTDTASADLQRTVAGDSIRWRWPALAGPTAAYVDVVTRVRPDAPAGALIAPRVAITSATGITRPSDDMVTAQPLTVVVPDLWLSALGPLSAARGAPLSWQVRWGNRAGGRAIAIEVTATLPAGATLLNTVPPATVDGRTLRWSRGDADPEGDAPIEILRIDAQVSTNAAAEDLVLKAGIRGLGRDAAPTDNTARAATRVLPGPPATIQLAAPPSVGVGSAATVSVLVLDGAGEPVADGTSVQVTTTLGDVDPTTAETVGGRLTVRFTGSDLPGRALITARAGAASSGVHVDILPAALRLASALEGPKGPASQTQVHPGEPLRWSLAVHNDDASTARDVRLLTTLPARLTLDHVTATGPLTADGAARPILDTIERDWRLGDLAPGAGVTVTLSSRVDEAAEWTGSDLLFARADLTTTTAVAAARDMKRTEQLRVFAADLRVSVRLDTTASTLRPGGFAVYDILFSNGQPQTEVAGAVVTSTLPAGTRFDHWQPDQMTLVHERTPFLATSRSLEWAIDQSLADAGAIRLWLRIDNDAPPAGRIVHRVAIGSPVPDLDPDNNVRDDGAFLAGIDLSPVVSGPAETEPGAEVTYTIELVNRAPHDAATGVVLTADLPAGATLIRVDDPGQLVVPGRVRWDYERVEAGGSRRVALDVRLPGDRPVGSTAVIGVQAFATEGEATPADNEALWTTLLVPGPVTSVTVQPDQADVVACAIGRTVVAAIARDGAGRPARDGTVVAWQTTAGRLDRLEAPTAAGVATATLIGGPPLGPAIVTAHVGPVVGQATLSLIAGPPASLALTANPDRVSAGGSTQLVAQALDGCGNVVADGWPVTFTAERGAFPGGESSAVVTTIGGAARARLAVGTRVGRLLVAADQGAVHAEITLDVVPPTPTPNPPRFTLWLPITVRPRVASR